jgi:6-pyruvoyltetrahydropterin/6-carboxytetrahydropterin synthase
MAYFEIIRRLEWDAMHRIAGHEGPCRAFHGHRYVAELGITGAALDEMGRVVDFGVVKEKVGRWIDEHWDHTAIFDRNDRTAAVEQINAENRLAGKTVYLLAGAPTAERIAQELFRVAADLLKPCGIQLTYVRIWETPNCSAIYQEGGSPRAQAEGSARPMTG